MDKEELQKNIALYYSKLPPETQDFFAKMEWLQTLQKISVELGFNANQTETLITETTLALLGMIHIDEYKKNLTSELNLRKDITDRMFLSIENSVLKDVQQQLIETFKKNEGGIETDTSLDSPELKKSFDEIVKKSNYQATLYNIAREYGLNVEQMGILEKAVTDLINGAMYPDEFEGYLESNLKLSLEKVPKLVTDINEKIFLKIRELLKLTNTPTGEDLYIEKEVEKVVGEDMNHDILKKAGIDIMPTQATTPPMPTTNVFNIPKREEILETTERPKPVIKNEINPMFKQKMSTPFQIPMVKTEHSLDNLSKTQTPSEPTLEASTIPVKKMTDIKTPVPQAKDYSKTGDPYRLNPNE